MLKDIKLGTKMIGGFLIVAAIVLVVGFFGWTGARQLQGHIEEIGTVRLPSIESLLIISEAQTAIDSAENALLSRDISLEERKAQYRRISDAWQRAEEAWAVYEPLPQTPEEARLWDQFVVAWDAWKADHETYLALSREYDAMIDYFSGQPLAKTMSFADALNTAITGVKDAQVLFGNQVQEWKNVLLRGTDPEMYDKYFNAFREREADIQETLKITRDQVAQLGFDPSFVDNLITAHADLGAAYREALSDMDRSDPLSGFAVDTAVRGVDRPTAEALEAVVAAARDAEAGMRDILDRMSRQALVANGVTFTAAEDLLLQIVDINTAVGEEAVATAEADGDRVQLIAIIGMITGTVLAFALGLILTRAITKPIIKGVNFARLIADGDLDIQLDVHQKDEIGVLADALRGMLQSLQYKAKIVERIADGDLTVDIEKASDKDGLGESLLVMKKSLNDILSQVMMAADQVTTGSDQVSQASQSLSQGATEQASSLEEISSSINEINSQSKQNAENATEANGLAKQAAGSAENGNNEMKNLTAAMQSINASSDEIKKVVKVIDDIAFQINLLALNANVEAARAGKYGKGFTVVAEEVRNLAVKSADAVRETSSMVDESIKNIEQGNQSVESTAKQLDEIVGGIAKVANFLDEIALASKEQAQGIEQVTEGLDQIEQVTQANTASAEESASASEELAGQAQELQMLISRFKLDNRERLQLPAP